MSLTLPAVADSILPRLVYADGADHQPHLTLPRHFRPTTSGGHIKPASGGLWTAPVTETAQDGTPLRSAWTDCCRREMPSEWGTDYDGLFIEITPTADARILRINCSAAGGWRGR